MLAYTGFVVDATTGEHLPSIGTLREIPGLGELVREGHLEQTSWSGYPLTYLGTARVFVQWLETLREHYFSSQQVPVARSAEHPRGIRTATALESKTIVLDRLRTLDPGRVVQVDLWDQS